jgi:polar amino acid transport system substrate-binding protein
MIRIDRVLSMFFGSFFFTFGFVASLRAGEVSVVTEYLHPFQVIKEDGALGGYSTEVVEQLFAKTGDIAKIDVLPWARAYQSALNEKNVMIYSMAKTPLRVELFHWIGTLSKERLFVWGLASNFTQEITHIDQLRELTFVTTNSSNPEQYFTKLGFKNIFRVNNREQIMGMLFKKRADFMVSSEFPLRDRMIQMGLDFGQLTRVYEVTQLNSDLSIAFNKETDPEMIRRYRLAFAELENEGVLTKLKEEWQMLD